MRVGENQKKAARVADLYGFLLKYHPDTVKKADQNRLQHISHDSLIITKGKGFIHNSRGKSGNGIDYLMEYENYSFQRAVAALAAFDGEHGEVPSSCPRVAQNVQKGDYKAPKKFEGRFTRAFAYLTNTRKIDAKIVQDLISKELLYEEDVKHNCVFISKHSNYGERVGTLSSVRFKGTVENSDEDGYWLYAPSEHIEKIYICESAIDAISLFQIRRERAAYVSIGGLKPESVKHVQSDFTSSNVILAVDADEAGDIFASKFPLLQRIRPQSGKDWNEVINPISEDLPY